MPIKSLSPDHRTVKTKLSYKACSQKTYSAVYVRRVFVDVETKAEYKTVKAWIETIRKKHFSEVCQNYVVKKPIILSKTSCNLTELANSSSSSLSDASKTSETLSTTPSKSNLQETFNDTNKLIKIVKSQLKRTKPEPSSLSSMTSPIQENSLKRHQATIVQRPDTPVVKQAKTMTLSPENLKIAAHLLLQEKEEPKNDKLSDLTNKKNTSKNKVELRRKITEAKYRSFTEKPPSYEEFLKRLSPI